MVTIPPKPTFLPREPTISHVQHGARLLPTCRETPNCQPTKTQFFIGDSPSTFLGNAGGTSSSGLPKRHRKYSIFLISSFFLRKDIWYAWRRQSAVAMRLREVLAKLMSTSSTSQKTARQATARSNAEKPEPVVAIALSDMHQLMRSARSARISTRLPRSPGCICSCHLLQDVCVSPSTAVFPAKGGGISTHTLSNASSVSLAVKITCSDNAVYRVNPVFAILEPGRCIALHIGRVEGPVKKDRLCVLLLEHDGVGTAKECFKTSEKRPASLCIPLTVVDE